MLIKNKSNLPSPIVRAVTNDPYTKGDSEFSATGLLKPPRISALLKVHEHEIEVDVLDRLFALYGQIGHTILERAGSPLGEITETRLFGVIDNTKISAQIDSLSLEEDGTLIDWKFTTVYKFMKKKPAEPDWVMQMNIQLEMLRQNDLGHLVKRMRIYGLLRDWRPKEKALQKDYPDKIAFHEIPIHPQESVREFIKVRIQKHRQAQSELPQCSPFDNWSWRRCSQYCEVNKFCSQWLDHKGEKDGI